MKEQLTLLPGDVVSVTVTSKNGVNYQLNQTINSNELLTVEIAPEIYCCVGGCSDVATCTYWYRRYEKFVSCCESHHHDLTSDMISESVIRLEK